MLLIPTMIGGVSSRGLHVDVDSNAIKGKNDHVYVSESFNNRISVFTCEGQFVTSFVTAEGFNPRGLAVDNSGVVYVCDSGNNCVKLYYIAAVITTP